MGVGWGVVVVIFENCCGNSLKQSMRGSGFSFPAMNFSASINNCYHFHLHEDVKLSPRYQSRSRFLDLGVLKMMGAKTTRSSWKRKSPFFYQCPHCSMTQGRAVLSPGHFVHFSLYFRTAGSAIWWFTKGNWSSMISPGKCALWRCISLSRWDQDVEDATTSQAAQNLT